MYMYVCMRVCTLSLSLSHTHIETQTHRPPLGRNKEFGMLSSSSLAIVTILLGIHN